MLLSVGEVAKAEAALTRLAEKSGRPQPLADALQQLIAAVKRQPFVATAKPQLASELLAASYYEQSQAVRETSLLNALRLAKRAAAVAPKFGFAWERVAELEFSFGRTKDALAALDQSLVLAPGNAQALALKGFAYAAQNQPEPARAWFDRAIAADAALGNAWLGRGLVRIHLGDKTGGREDLLVAAALEPQRAELRSYLGKAYAHVGDDAHAAKELALAKKLDPKDPTAWLYSALVNQQNNNINDAIRDLEKSQALNDNRSVYRSQLLLDEDESVRSANLAGVYRDAGMFDLAMREAGRAVSSDYANYSAHLFLANSYEQMRDPDWTNLRYETPANSEFWIANLLAPPGAGTLSPIVSEQPNAKLFEQNRVGVVSDTTFLSRGAWMEAGAQFGTVNNFSYDFESKYFYDPGQRADNDREERDLMLTVKDQITPQDSAFFSFEEEQNNSGDVNEHYAHPTAPSDVRFDQSQSPNLVFGFHHEWSPGVHTLFLASRSMGENTAGTANAGHLLANSFQGAFNAVLLIGDHELITTAENENAVELQQIFEQPQHTTIVGARYSWGDLQFGNVEWDPDWPQFYSFFIPNQNFPNEIENQNITDTYRHLTAYAYHDWQLVDALKISAGVAYDYLHQPAVVDTAPFTYQEEAKAQVSPKAGIIWTPTDHTTVRAAYTRSLSGFINDEATRLEPTEVAGFNQAFRSIIPNTVVGDNSGSTLDTCDISIEQKFDTGTYVGLSGEILSSKDREYQGAFLFDGVVANAYPGGLGKHLDYRERSLTFTVDQLLGKQWSAGARYELSQADLNVNYVDLNPANLVYVDPNFRERQSLDSILNTVSLHANWNHPSGLFAIFEGNWYHQYNSGFSPAEPGDAFMQFNAYAGCRFWHRKAELSFGILNIFDTGYQLEPLNFYNEMAHSRTLLARLLISF